MMPRIGSFCTGYGGLDMAVHEVLGGSLAWVSDIDPSACKILAHRYPEVPNIGDLTVADWQHLVDLYGRPQIVTGGYPCQPFSIGGRRKGTADDRHIWPDIACALRVLRPRLAFFENVGNHLRLGFDTVLRDLADLGFDAEWVVVRASDALAPHERRRLFILAVAQDSDGEPWVEWRQSASRQAQGGRARSDAGRRGRASAADADGIAVWQQSVAESGRGGASLSSVPGAVPPADADGIAARRREVGGSVAGEAGTDAQEARRRGGDSALVHPGEGSWGRYAAAIARWEGATGVPAPRPTDDRGRLNTAFVEWMQGVPAGHVTQVPGLGRQGQLKALGNGVVRQQGALALRVLLDRLGQDATRIAA